MALGTVLASAASAALPSLIGGIFGKKAAQPYGDPMKAGAFTPPGFSAGGLNGRFAGGNYTVTPDANRSGQVGQMALTFPEQAAKLAQLRQQLAPGYSGLRTAQFAELDNARSRAIGNLRENLSARRVLGSSFAQDALTRAEAEFSQQRANVAATTFLQELEATHNLINEEFEVARGEFTTRLDDLNLEAELGAKLAANATTSLQNAAQVKALLAARAAEGTGIFYGKALEPAFNAIGKGIDSLISGNSGLGNWMTSVIPA